MALDQFDTDTLRLELEAYRDIIDPTPDETARMREIEQVIASRERE